MKFPTNTATVAIVIATAGLLSACASMQQPTPVVPAAIAIPAGNQVAMRLVGAGDLNYECRVSATDAAAFSWVLASPNAILSDASMGAVGKYYGGPTWELNDGSKVTGKQLAVSPGAAGSIALQLVQASPATGNGKLNGVTYIQRLNTMGGVPAALPCDASKVGSKHIVKYQADYVFYKAA